MHIIYLDESTGTRISLFLVKNLENLENLREKILAGSLDCCVIKPCLIVDPLQIAIAANKAAIDKREGKLTTKSLNSELLFNLSISKNITQSLNSFGIDDKSKEVLLVVFEENGESRAEGMKTEIKGEFCNLKHIQDLSDFNLIKKTYKIKDQELQVSSLIDSVISRIAVKEIGLH